MNNPGTTVHSARSYLPVAFKVCKKVVLSKSSSYLLRNNIVRPPTKAVIRNIILQKHALNIFVSHTIDP